jgi:hypothetical protein
MNRNQRRSLVAAIVVVALMGFFPPTVKSRGFGEGSSRGYHSILDIPQGLRVDVGLLLAQWFGVILVAGAGYFVLREDPSSSE